MQFSDIKVGQMVRIFLDEERLGELRVCDGVIGKVIMIIHNANVLVEVPDVTGYHGIGCHPRELELIKDHELQSGDKIKLSVPRSDPRWWMDGKIATLGLDSPNEDGELFVEFDTGNNEYTSYYVPKEFVEPVENEI